MAASTKWYVKAFKSAFNKEIDFNEAGKIKVLLTTSGYSPDQDAHDYLDDITNEVSSSGTNYARQTLTNCTINSTVDGTNKFYLDADDVTFPSLTSTQRYAPICYDTGTASTSPLIGYVDFGADEARTAADLVIQWNAAGIVGTTVS